MTQNWTLARTEPAPQAAWLARWLALGGAAGPLLFVWGSGELARAAHPPRIGKQQGATMMTSHTTTDSTTVTASSRLAQRYVAAILALAGTSMLAAGLWAGLAPRSFARFVEFPYHQHFLHDLGAFQVGIGATLLLALAWRDAATVALAGFLVANTLHALSHAIDQDLGGHPSDPWAIGAVSLLAAAALVVRVRQPRAPTSRA